MTLDEIAIKHGADKATTHPVKGHGYALHYALFFEELRNRPIKFLEIGVGGGESIRTWMEYFPNAMIYGIDMVSGTNEWNTVGSSPDPRYRFTCGNQTDETFWKCFRVDCGGDWDVIVDDGGHFSDQIITSFDGLWQHVKSGGLYCVEDLGVSYGEGSIFLTKGWPRHMDFIRFRLDDINLTRNKVKSMYCSNELAIMQKA
jgi:demethylmacrocin O-methyltransferase